MSVTLKRVYDEPSAGDGYRVLVDRLWPRGLSKERAELDLWLKEVAPSAELRTRWHHDLENREQFEQDYRAELAVNPALDELRTVIATHPTVTLLFGARDPERNHATVLLDALEHGVGRSA